MQDNQEQQNGQAQEFSSVRVIFAIVVFSALVFVFFNMFEQLDKPTTIRTSTEGYTTTTVMDGPLGKTTCRTTVIGGNAVMRCD